MAEYLDEHEANINRQQALSGNTLMDKRARGARAIPGAIPDGALGSGPDRLRAEGDKTKDGC